jgi:dTDP-4-dehydrorhamnose reductase
MLWIPGANGLLGRNLVRKVQNTHFVATGREVDISDLKRVREFVRENQGITHIVNCAAYSMVDAAEKERDEAFKTNAIGPEHLATAAGEIGAKLIHISTDYVFSGAVKKPQGENDPVAPCNYYGETKLEGERRALAKGACVIRTSGIFGTGGGKNFVAKLLQMLQTEKVIRLTDDQWGRFTYAPDLAGAILQMLDSNGLFQYANQGILTKYEFGIAMREEAILLGFPVVTESILPVPGSTFPSPCKRPTYSAFDTTKIEQQITIRHWRSALRDFLCEQLPAYS